MNTSTATNTANPTPKRRVLVVEDNQFTATLYKKVLEREGYEVVHIANGRSAFEAILDQKFDLVMLDLMLPEMDGLEILKRVHARDQHFETPVVVLSEVDLAAVREQVREYGVKQFLTKTGADALKIVEAIGSVTAEAAERKDQKPAAPKATHNIDPKLVNLNMVAPEPFEVRKISQVYPSQIMPGPYHHGTRNAGSGHRQVRPLVTSLRRFLFLW